MKIQSHKHKNYSKDSATGGLFAHFFPVEEKQDVILPAKEEIKKETNSSDNARLSQHNISRTSKKSGADFGSTGWGNSNLDGMLDRLK